MDMTELLLTRGADVDAKDRDGDTPLHDAAFRGHEKIVGLLLAHGADVGAKNNAGRTPRDEALRRWHKEVAQLLGRHVDAEP
jgi:ankyrin repeat protein